MQNSVNHLIELNFASDLNFDFGIQPILFNWNWDIKDIGE